MSTEWRILLAAFIVAFVVGMWCDDAPSRKFSECMDACEADDDVPVHMCPALCR